MEEMVKGRCSSKKVTIDLNCGPTINYKLSLCSGIGYLITESNLSSTLRNLMSASCEYVKALPIVL